MRPEVGQCRGHCSHPNLVWAAPPLRSIIIFGRDSDLARFQMEKWITWPAALLNELATEESASRKSLLNDLRVACKDRLIKSPKQLEPVPNFPRRSRAICIAARRPRAGDQPSVAVPGLAVTCVEPACSLC
jgi:hypothetical protein